jgi:Tol biopolymer transport system component
VKDFKSKTFLYSLSSDGKSVALVSFAEEGRLQIYSMDTGQKLQSFALPNLIQNFISFSPDNQGVLYTTKSGADSTIWRQPLRSVAPVEVAKIPEKSVFLMHPSPDGTKLGLITTAPQAQAVLVRNIR